MNKLFDKYLTYDVKEAKFFEDRIVAGNPFKWILEFLKRCWNEFVFVVFYK